MADPSDANRDRKAPGRYSDRADKRRSEPVIGPKLAHVIHGALTGAALSSAGLHVSDHPVATLTVITASTVGSMVVGSVRERDGERRGYDAGLADGLEKGRRLGRAAAMLDVSGRIKKLNAAKPRSSGRRFLPRGNRDRGGR